MFEIKKEKVNRKQFHYLLSKFLMEKGLAKKFFDYSLRFKLQSNSYSEMFKKYNFSKNDTFSEHLYKCIDIYCNEKDKVTKKRWIDGYYHGNIHGIFRLIPATFDEDYASFWGKI